MKDINQKIMEWIQEGRNNGYEIVLMGDFNLDYEKYKENPDRLKRTNPNFLIFDCLENSDLYDPIKTLYDISQKNLFLTFTSYSSSASSYLDYIWILHNLFSSLKTGRIFNTSDFFTDHKGLFVALWFDNFTKIPIDSYKTLKRTLYLYDQTLDSQWDSFQKFLSNSSNLHPEFFNGTNKDIESQWAFFKSEIIKASNKYVKKKSVLVNKTPSNPLIVNTIYPSIRYVISLRRKLKKYSKKFMILQNWKSHKKILKNISESRFSYGWNIPRDSHQLSRTLNSLDLLYKILMLEYRNQLHSFKLEKIQHSLNKCCQDLEDNQKHMINNIMDKEIHTIILDRVLVNRNNQEILYTEASNIKKAAMDHFQNVAGSQHTSKEIPPNWHSTYSPISTINDSIYNNLMNEVTDQEWLDTINSLPKGKAPGPSLITYDMIKKLLSEYLLILRNLINMCIK